MAAQYVPLIIVGIVFIFMVIWQNRLNSIVDYQCSNCGAVFSIDPLQGAIAPHSLGKKYVRCPSCGQMTWAVPVKKG